jgi:hypothetical protein
VKRPHTDPSAASRIGLGIVLEIHPHAPTCTHDGENKSNVGASSGYALCEIEIPPSRPTTDKEEQGWGILWLCGPAENVTHMMVRAGKMAQCWPGD